MGWHKRMCRFGHIHHVFRQEASDSCGPSCALMLFQRLRGVKLDAGESYVGFTAYSQATTKYDGTRGTGGLAMARFLKNVLGTPTEYHRPKFPREVLSGVVGNLDQGHPVVMGVMWLSSKGLKNQGGHWLIVDKVSRVFGKSYLCVNDPGDGHVHVVQANTTTFTRYTPTYDGNTLNGELDDYIDFTNLP